MRDIPQWVSIIGERLGIAMQAKGVDQAALAQAVGCTQAAISMILSGKTHRSRLLPDIADYLGVSLRWLKGQDVPQADEGTTAPATSEEPKLRIMMMPMVVPSEDALTEMFAALLSIEQPGESLDERARFLAQLLPSALAQLQERIPVEDLAVAHARARASRLDAKERRARQ